MPVLVGMALQQKSLRDYLSQHSCYFIKKLILSFYFDFVVFIFWEIVKFFFDFFPFTRSNAKVRS
jgi:hypothetical protein